METTADLDAAQHTAAPSATPARVPATTSTAADRSASTAASSLTEFLAFKLGGEEYGIDILRVQEIRSFEAPTRIANAPAHLLGVLNLRGLIVPIVDLRIKFQLEPAVYDSFTVTIVLGIATRVVGVVVDAVSAVVALTPEQLHAVPEMHSSVGSEHLLAIGSIDDRMLILMDIETLMNSPAMGLVNTINP